MAEKQIAAVVLAAGQGTRMHSDLPKVMHKLAGQPMINHLLATLDDIGVGKSIVVIAPHMDTVKQAVAPHQTAIQPIAKGTGDAVKAVQPLLGDFDGDVLILYGDAPLVSAETLYRLISARKEGAKIAVLAFIAQDAARYGRLVVDSDNTVDRIVEYKDASEAERAINLCNSGMMCLSASDLFRWLSKIGNSNAAGEYYLTEIITIAKEEGAFTHAVIAPENELLGVNSLAELAGAEKVVQDNLRRKFMDSGVTLLDPSTTYFSFDTIIGAGAIIEPCVFFGIGVQVADNVIVKAFSHFEQAKIGDNANIGPFSRLRPDAVVQENAHIGNFVEIKKSVIEQGAKVNHLTYIGDARVGAKANIGAGTITCNYDGFNKNHTDIGEGAFIGSNTALVAPVKIGAGAVIGAGSTITKEVEADALALTRAEQLVIKGWAVKYRKIKAERKKQGK